MMITMSTERRGKEHSGWLGMRCVWWVTLFGEGFIGEWLAAWENVKAVSSHTHSERGEWWFVATSGKKNPALREGEAGLKHKQ